VFDVEPLSLPPEPEEGSVEAILGAPAVRLFRDRATAADPRFEITAENAEDVARICRALDGVPLAIELAAACIRALTPAAMLAKLDRMLPLLANAARDVPERQRTIQATVEWSVDLLEPEPRALFARLGVFAGDFSLDAVEAVTAGAPWAADLLGTLLVLVDSSLLRQRDDAGLPLFSMLGTVREVATARFELDPDAAAVRRAHAEHYVQLAVEIEPMLRGATQVTALARLEAERDNLRAAYRHLIAIEEVDVVADAVWRLLLYWWIRGLLPEAKAWMVRVLEAGLPLSKRTRAIALAYSAWVPLWQTDGDVRTEPLEESAALFREVGDGLGEGIALSVLALACMSIDEPDIERAEASQRAALEIDEVRRDPTFRALLRTALGRILLQRGRPAEALQLFEEAQAEAERSGDLFVESIALTQIGWARLASVGPDPHSFVRNLELAARLRNDDGAAYALEGLSASAAAIGDLRRAGTLLGAAETLRARTGLTDQRSYLTYQPFVAAVLASDRAAEFEAARAAGRRMPRRAVFEAVLGPELTAAATA
jgi:tetratricopeptide (TPR) repeat protein